MIQFDEGLTTCGRVTWGFKAGYIIRITPRTYRVRWLDGEETEQLRPDLDEDEQEAAVDRPTADFLENILAPLDWAPRKQAAE
jgi:hypothetical protein